MNILVTRRVVVAHEFTYQCIEMHCIRLHCTLNELTDSKRNPLAHIQTLTLRCTMVFFFRVKNHSTFSLQFSFQALCLPGCFYGFQVTAKEKKSIFIWIFVLKCRNWSLQASTKNPKFQCPKIFYVLLPSLHIENKNKGSKKQRETEKIPTKKRNEINWSHWITDYEWA